MYTFFFYIAHNEVEILSILIKISDNQLNDFSSPMRTGVISQYYSKMLNNDWQLYNSFEWWDLEEPGLFEKFIVMKRSVTFFEEKEANIYSEK